jgi:amidohydrolase
MELLNAARGMAEQIVADRRDIHAHPELGYKENRTSELVADRLTKLGIDVRTGVGGTGVIGLMEGGKPGKTVLLRADMDGLPIQEVGTDVRPYASQNAGVMHACGHDGHTAMLLAAAKLLTEHRSEIKGTVKFMFQPAEEGGFGAVKMLEDGLMDAPNVDAAFALHVDSLLEAGLIQIQPGPMFAAADRYTILVRGKGGHAAAPNLTIDPVVVAAHIVIALQTLISREIAPHERAVITLAELHAGTAENIIPDTVEIKGTMRNYNPKLREYLQQRIRELSGGLASAMRASVEIDWRPGYPPLVNHASGAELVAEIAEREIGPGTAVVREPTMGAEDFSYLLERVPGAMFRLGTRMEEWTTRKPHHTADFDMDESALPVGTAMLAATAINYLATN